MLIVPESQQKGRGQNIVPPGGFQGSAPLDFVSVQAVQNSDSSRRVHVRKEICDECREAISAESSISGTIRLHRRPQIPFSSGYLPGGDEPNAGHEKSLHLII